MWVGFDQPAPIGREAYGARVALPIWADFMKRVARALPPAEFAVPEGLQAEELCSVSYLRPVDGCPVYTRVLQGRRRDPDRSCARFTAARSSSGPRARRGLFRSLGSKIAGLFKGC